MKKGHFVLENLNKYDIPNSPASFLTVRNSLPTYDIVGAGLQIESRIYAHIRYDDWRKNVVRNSASLEDLAKDGHKRL